MKQALSLQHRCHLTPKGADTHKDEAFCIANNSATEKFPSPWLIARGVPLSAWIWVYTSSRCTETSLGALMPIRTWFPLTASTVIVTLSPITRLSPVRLVRINMVILYIEFTINGFLVLMGMIGGTVLHTGYKNRGGVLVPQLCCGASNRCHEGFIASNYKYEEKHVYSNFWSMQMELYVGIDVSKASLDIHVNGINEKDLKLENSQSGIENLVQFLKSLQLKDHVIKLVICEATGGYERLLSKILQAADLPVHTAHPNKVRNFAKALGQFAKTDRIDAKILSEFAKVFKPNPDTDIITPEFEYLKALFLRRQQLLAEKLRESNRLDKDLLVVLRQSIEKHILWLKKELQEIEKLIEKHLKSHDAIKSSVELLTSVPGVGALTAIALLVRLPELGTIEDKKIAALVGVAPLNRDSGKITGKRFIQGGRRSIRSSLYMAAVSSIRFNSDMKAYYQHLRKKGKAAKVALTAVVRKLIILLNKIARRKTPWENRSAVLATA